MKSNEILENSHKELSALYAKDMDILEVSNGEPGEHSYVIAESLSANLNRESEVVGFTLGCASSLLLPYLLEYISQDSDKQRTLWYSPNIVIKSGSFPVLRKQSRQSASRKQLTVTYSKEADILDLKTGEPVKDGEDVSADLVVFYNESDDLVRFTLENAAQLLLPCFQQTVRESATPTSGG